MFLISSRFFFLLAAAAADHMHSGGQAKFHKLKLFLLNIIKSFMNNVTDVTLCLEKMTSISRITINDGRHA